MNKRSDGKRRRRSRSKRSKRCKTLLGKKIGINIHEGIYANKAQAIAVAYSQIRKKHPSCRKILGKKSRRRSMRRRFNDGVQGTGENNYLTIDEQNAFKNLFQLNANGIYESKTFQTFKFMDVHFGNDIGIKNLNNFRVYISAYTSWFTGVTTYYFHIRKSENPNHIEENIIGELSKIIEYQLA
jgi:hypothetical protein